MARPVNFKKANQRLGAGDNPDTMGMPVLVATRPMVTGNIKYYVSKWKLGDDELAEINRTGCVFVAIMHTPVPISIHGLNPCKYMLSGEPEYKPIVMPHQN